MMKPHNAEFVKYQYGAALKGDACANSSHVFTI